MAFLVSLLRRLLVFLVHALPLGLRRWVLLVPFRPAQATLLSRRSSPREVQLTALRRIIEANKRTEFGRAHAFDQITDPTSFASRVPLRAYAELEPYILRQRSGESGVLVESSLMGFAVSGGSRGRPRAIPVTAETLGHWRWVEELLLREAIRRHPQVARGVSLHLLPCYQAQTNRTALPLMPMAVLAASARAPTRLPEAVPPALFSLPDETKRFYLILRLALAQPVTLLRAASPGTLGILAAHLQSLGPQLIEDLASGRVQHLESLPEEVRWAIPAQLPQRKLADSLRRSLELRGKLEPRQVWPGLEVLISSATGPSRAAAERLPDFFGGLPLLDPGYRAAEAIITLPSLEDGGGQLALGCQYLEFLPEGGASSTMSMESLQIGQRVQPVVSGPNGLYRYVMDDVTEVVELQRGVPRLAVLGRARCRLRLDQGVLLEEEVSESSIAACRSCGVALSSCTGWLERPEPRPSESSVRDERREGWLSRIFRRGKSSSGPALPALTLAIEPAEALTEDQVQRLARSLDGELRRRSRPYEEHRAKGKLAAPVLLVLREGALARRSRRRLADGLSDGHAPMPALSEDGCPIDPDEIASRA